MQVTYKTAYDMMEDLRKAEKIIQDARWEVLNGEFQKNTNDSEYKDLKNRVISIMSIAEVLKNNLSDISWQYTNFLID